MKVSQILSIHVIVVVILMITPVIALKWVSIKSQDALQKNNEIYSLVLVELRRIDGSLKNSRFHAYAGFMHDKNLSVAGYHAHPFQLHVDVVNNELKSANERWKAILSNISSSNTYYEEILSLKSQYDDYMSAGSKPVVKALQEKDWDSIVRFVTAAIPQYADFSDSIQQLQDQITQQAEIAYESSQEELSKLSFSLMVLYALSALIYVVFSFWLKRKIITPLRENIQVAKKISQGDLTSNTLMKTNDEFGALSNAMEVMRKQLSEMIHHIILESDHVGSYSEKLKSASQRVAESIQNQMLGLTTAASSLEELLVNIENLSENAKNTNEKAEYAEDAATQSMARINDTESGVQVVSTRLTTTSQQIEELSEQVKEISSITGVIQDVAAQTNLLALNAAIEAARAGEQGRGFAVVADEVRNLAATTTQSVDKISVMITNIQANSSQTVTSMEDSCNEAEKVVSTAGIAKGSIHSINEATSILKDLISEITRSLLEQKASSNNLSKNVDSVAELSRQNNELVEHVSIMSDDLTKTSEKLKVSVSGFRI